MITFISNFIVSFLATLVISIIFSVPKKQLIFSGLTGAIAHTSYFILVYFNINDTFSMFVSIILTTLFARIMAIYRKCPTTIFIIPGIIIPVPGTGVYFTMYYLVNNELYKALEMGLNAAKTSVIIAISMAITLFIPLNRIQSKIISDK